MSDMMDSLKLRRSEPAEVAATPKGDEHPLRVIGRRLEVARKRRNWTYREMATQTGIRSSTLHYWIWHRRRAWSHYELKKLVETIDGEWTDEWECLWRRSVEVGPARVR